LIQEELGNKKHYLMNSFYIAQRKRLNILVQDGKPIGGKWSFDIQNRRKMPGALRVPEPMNIKQNKYVKEAVEYIKKHFDHNPGTIEEFIWPTNHDEAKKWLHNFLSRRLCLFGPYQDAIDPTKDFLFHSLLSPLLNIGLLTPAYVIDETLAYAHKHTVPLNCLEGFIRQIIGWREFVQGIYVLHGEKQRKSNFFKHTKKLPASFWDATTGILPIDNALQKIVKTGYAHHIERLMVLGNFMLLIEVDPNEVYRWFMELFIDAYDWVMVPNVYGMSQYADGGLMTTKPYFSSSNYIRAMSNYKNGSWCELWDALYWHFIVKNNSLIKKNARLSFINLYLRNKKKDILEKQLKIAQKYLKEI
jgi:deoxyribodipyrimidine photolyase-related protein